MRNTEILIKKIEKISESIKKEITKISKNSTIANFVNRSRNTLRAIYGDWEDPEPERNSAKDLLK